MIPPPLAALLAAADPLLAGQPPEVRLDLGAIQAAAGAAVTRVAFVGTFSAGKSTLVNALLGHELLPARTNPETAVPTVVGHGPHLRVHAVAADGAERPMSLPDFARLCTLGTGSPVPFRSASIRVPAPILAGGLEFIDSPGIFEHGDRDRITEQFLREADAIAFVTPARGGFSTTERAKLQELTAPGGREVLVVVTMFDQIRPAEVLQVQHRARGLAAAAGVPAERVLPVSAADALDPARPPGGTGVPALAAVLDGIHRTHAGLRPARAALRLADLLGRAAAATAGRYATAEDAQRVRRLVDLEIRCVRWALGPRGFPPPAMVARPPRPAGPSPAATALGQAASLLHAGLPAAPGVAARTDRIDRMLAATATPSRHAVSAALGGAARRLRRYERHLAAREREAEALAGQFEAPRDRPAVAELTDVIVRSAQARSRRYWRRHVRGKGRQWIGDPPTGLRRLDWTGAVDAYFDTVSARLTDRARAAYGTFVVEELAPGALEDARGALRQVQHGERIERLTAAADALLAGLDGIRGAAPPEVAVPIAAVLPALADPPTPKLKAGALKETLANAVAGEVDKSYGMSWAAGFAVFGPDDMLGSRFRKPVAAAFDAWSEQAFTTSADKPLRKWSAAVAAELTRVAGEDERSAAVAGRAGSAAMCAARVDLALARRFVARAAAELAAVRRDFLRRHPHPLTVLARTYTGRARRAGVGVAAKAWPQKMSGRAIL